jgi:cytidylate kinase
MSRSRPIVAIDGPAGAGKSTIARRVADALGYVLVDTGALYRTVALAATRRKVTLADGDGVADVARGLIARNEIRLERDPATGVRVLLGPAADREDVSEAIRTPEMSLGASTVSAHPGVRAALLDIQRRAGADGGVVLEGRDIGTVVFPDAEVKIFLTASPETRARRRYDELVAKGQEVSYEATLEQVRARDHQDEGRAVAPLRRAEDAHLVDSSSMSPDEVVERMLSLVRAWRA